MKKIITLSIMLAAFCYATADGQYHYKQAGVRSGLSGGIFMQYSHNTRPVETSLMGMVGFRKNGIQFTAMKITYETTLSEISDDLWFTWGYGGHGGFIYTDRLNQFGEPYYFRAERFCPLIGIDGWAGLEYRFGTIPLSIGLNVMPWFEIVFPSFISFFPVDVGISIAYRF